MSHEREQTVQQWIEAVYRDNHKILYRYAEVLVARYCRAMASSIDDLVQETFFILYKKRLKLYDHENITGWLIVALRYNFNNRWRKIKRRSEILMEPEKTELFGTGHNPVERAVFSGNAEVLEIIRAAINDDDKYQAFIDFHLNHVPIQQLAEKYGKSYDSMKVQLFRCRKLCKALMEENSGISSLFIFFCVTFFDLMT